MQTTVINFVFYSCKFAPSLFISFCSIVAVMICGKDVKIDNIILITITLLIWLLLTFSVLEYIKRRLIAAWLSFLSMNAQENAKADDNNSGVDELLENLKEGVVILDDQENSILFTNREASKKLSIKEGGKLKYVFDASNNIENNRSIEILQPVFGVIEKLEPQGLDYCGFLKDMNNIEAKLSL